VLFRSLHHRGRRHRRFSGRLRRSGHQYRRFGRACPPAARVLTGWRVAVGTIVAVVIVVAALVDVATGGSVGDVPGASGSKSPIASTISTSGWITDAGEGVAMAAGCSVGSGVLSTLRVGRGAAVSIAASRGWSVGVSCGAALAPWRCASWTIAPHSVTVSMRHMTSAIAIRLMIRTSLPLTTARPRSSPLALGIK